MERPTVNSKTGGQNRQSIAVDEQILDQTVLEDLRKLLDDDFQLFIKTFLHDMDHRCQVIVNATAIQDLDVVRHAAHSLKGSACNLGAHLLTNICALLETAARDGDVEQIKTSTQDLEQQRHQVRNRISQLA